MEIETAIIQLKNRAEVAQKRAATQRQLSEAQELVNICNSIIDYFNETERQRSQIHNLQRLIHTLSEYIGVNPEDIDSIVCIDDNFLRQRLEYRLEKEGDFPHWMFHSIGVDWEIYQDTLNDINYYRHYLIPLLKQKSDKELKDWEDEGMPDKPLFWGKELAKFRTILAELEFEVLDY